MNDNKDTERLLGKLLAKAEGLEKRLDDLTKDIKDRREKHDNEIDKLHKRITNLNTEWTTFKAGRKAIIALITGAAAFGVFLVKAIEFLLTYVS